MTLDLVVVNDAVECAEDETGDGEVVYEGALITVDRVTIEEAV